MVLFDCEKLRYLCGSNFKIINNIMKKVLSLLVVAGMFTFASCESKKTEETTTTETTTEGTATEGTDMSAEGTTTATDTAATTGTEGTTTTTTTTTDTAATTTTPAAH